MITNSLPFCDGTFFKKQNFLVRFLKIEYARIRIIMINFHSNFDTMHNDTDMIQNIEKSNF